MKQLNLTIFTELTNKGSHSQQSFEDDYELVIPADCFPSFFNIESEISLENYKALILHVFAKGSFVSGELSAALCRVAFDKADWNEVTVTIKKLCVDGQMIRVSGDQDDIDDLINDLYLQLVREGRYFYFINYD